MDWYSRSGIFSCGNCVLLWRTKCNVTNGNITNDDFLVFFLNEKSEYKVLSAKMFAKKLVIEQYFVGGVFSHLKKIVIQRHWLFFGVPLL